jgi:hypothetical protein
MRIIIVVKRSLNRKASHIRESYPTAAAIVFIKASHPQEFLLFKELILLLKENKRFCKLLFYIPARF